MMTQKILIVVAILCLTVSVASVIKFSERKRLTFFTGLISLFMPIFLAVFKFKYIGRIFGSYRIQHNISSSVSCFPVRFYRIPRHSI